MRRPLFGAYARTSRLKRSCEILARFSEALMTRTRVNIINLFSSWPQVFSISSIHFPTRKAMWLHRECCVTMHLASFLSLFSHAPNRFFFLEAQEEMKKEIFASFSAFARECKKFRNFFVFAKEKSQREPILNFWRSQRCVWASKGVLRNRKGCHH